jgi:hypothetical protein
MDDADKKQVRAYAPANDLSPSITRPFVLGSTICNLLTHTIAQADVLRGALFVDHTPNGRGSTPASDGEAGDAELMVHTHTHTHENSL